MFGNLVERYPDRTSDHLKKLVQTGRAHSAYDYLTAKALQDKLRADAVSANGWLRRRPDVASVRRGARRPKAIPAMPNIVHLDSAQVVPAVCLPAGFRQKAVFRWVFRSSAPTEKIIERFAWQVD